MNLTYVDQYSFDATIDKNNHVEMNSKIKILTLQPETQPRLPAPR